MAGFTDERQAIWMSSLFGFANFIGTFIGLHLVDRCAVLVLVTIFSLLHFPRLDTLFGKFTSWVVTILLPYSAFVVDIRRVGRRLLMLRSLASVILLLILIGGGFYLAEVLSTGVRPLPAETGVSSYCPYSSCFDCVQASLPRLGYLVWLPGMKRLVYKNNVW